MQTCPYFVKEILCLALQLCHNYGIQLACWKKTVALESPPIVPASCQVDLLIIDLRVNKQVMFCGLRTRNNSNYLTPACTLITVDTYFLLASVEGCKTEISCLQDVVFQLLDSTFYTKICLSVVVCNCNKIVF